MALLACGALVVASMATMARAGTPTLTLSASPTTVKTWAPGGSAGTSTVTVKATNEDGTAAGGLKVTIAITSPGSGGVPGTPSPVGPSLSASSVTTGADGTATVTYTAGALQSEDTIEADTTDGSASATATVSTCLDPSNATTCGINVPIPWDQVPCNPSSPGTCLPGGHSKP